MTTLQRFASDIKSMQNASNLIALLPSFREHMIKLAQEEKLSTDEINRHPLTVAFVSKLVSLSGFDGQTEYEAFQELDRIIQTLP